MPNYKQRLRRRERVLLRTSAVARWREHFMAFYVGEQVYVFANPEGNLVVFDLLTLYALLQIIAPPRTHSSCG